MTSEQFWWYFWTVCFVIGGGGFAVVALVVIARGVGDLKEMIRYLKSKSRVD